jgi:hypothetical protein
VAPGRKKEIKEKGAGVHERKETVAIESTTLPVGLYNFWMGDASCNKGS